MNISRILHCQKLAENIGAATPGISFPEKKYQVCKYSSLLIALETIVFSIYSLD